MRADAKSHGLLTFRRSEAKSNFTRLNELYVFIFFSFSFFFSFFFLTLLFSLANILNIHEAWYQRNKTQGLTFDEGSLLSDDFVSERRKRGGGGRISLARREGLIRRGQVFDGK